MKTFLTAIFLTVSFSFLIAQNQLQQAMDYYNHQQYDKAAPIFKKLYRQNHSKYYFDYYIDCLLKTQNYDQALKTIDREIQKNPQDLTLLADKVYILSYAGKNDLAQKLTKQIINKLPPNPTIIKQVANQFIHRKMYDQALEILEKGRKITKSKFYQEYYSIYALERNFDKMIDVLLDWLKANPGQFSFVQRTFQAYLNNDVNNEFYNLLYEKLKQRTKKHFIPEYSRLMIWLLTEKSQFTQAVQQAIMYDKKNHGFGTQVFETGMKAIDNDSLNAAQLAFDYIISKGTKTPYYYQARQEIIKVLYDKTIAGQITSPKQIQNLEQKYIDLINEFGITAKTAQALTQLAHLEAFYLNNPSKGLEYINKTLQINNLDNKIKGQLLLEKANIELLQGKPYAAAILYAQAYELNKDNNIGAQAQLMQAKTFFFIGKINWAKQMFDIIKGQNTLTANDAIFYTILIDDASTDSAKLNILKTFGKAQYMAFKNNTDSAISLLDSIIGLAYFLADYALMEKYKVHYQHGQYELAAQDLQQLLNSFPTSLIADHAAYLLGLLYEQKLNDPEKAMDYFKKVLFDFRGSMYAEYARRHYRKLALSANKTQNP